MSAGLGDGWLPGHAEVLAENTRSRFSHTEVIQKTASGKLVGHFNTNSLSLTLTEGQRLRDASTCRRLDHRDRVGDF
jgi:hypothetical protein